ncbi:MAG TPA: Fe-S cluster assembly protein SufD [Rhizomicrobium sp.]|jgi:Fe-S cluster assembly protein SufD|nr:Fe-S cluster assembly protein SufD [Rhizomicrobium sp.]
MNAPWLDARRAEANAAFVARGIPHRRIEEWKYSDLRASLDREHIEQTQTAKWRIENLPDGVELFDLSEGDAPDWVKRHLGTVGKNTNAMNAASFALAHSGFALRVPKNAAISAPIRLNFSDAGHARALIVVEEGAAATLLESQSGGTEFRNIGVEVSVAANSQLTHIRMSEVTEAVQVEEVAVKVARDALYRGHFANFGAKLSRLELQIALEDKGASANLSGVSVQGERTHSDVTTHIVHASGHTQSGQSFRHVAGGHARSIYQGKITVSEGANGSDSTQTAKGLLLGLRAEIDLKPELEIFADDVKCAHGAAVGDLDTDSLFYLRARGIPESEARNLLIRAFLEDTVSEIADETIRGEVWRAVEAALPSAMEQIS